MANPASYRPPTGAIPTDPGVYRFLDAYGNVIYVGKAKNLRNRLNSYFADPDNLHFRTKTMVYTAAKVIWTVVATEAEALQLEYTWIKQYDPRFNVRFRDDKSYPWLCVTWDEEFPRVFVGRGAKKKGWRYYGPFGQAWAVRQTLDSLLPVFPMRSCTNGVFRTAKASNRACLLGYIGKCSAPCVGTISADEHRELVSDICAFWAGQTKGLERKLTTRMREAAENQEYEQAAKLRDALFALQQATEKNDIILPDRTDADVLAVADDPLEVAVHIFHIRKGLLRGERSWIADRADDRPLAEMLEQFIWQLYLADESGSLTGIPPQLILPEAPCSADLLTELLTEAAGHKVVLHVPQRGVKKAVLHTVQTNADQALARHKTKRASDLATRSEALTQLQEALGMTQACLRIEGFDISHLQGNQVVGSMVVFEDGMARKSEYRRFIIKSFEGSNDIAAMDEVLRRRLGRLLTERHLLAGDDVPLDQLSEEQCADLIDPNTRQAKKFSYAPALIVVDGGLPQVNAAQKVLDDLDLADEITLIGLAKRLEEIWVPGCDFPIILPRNSQALYLLQRVRDESHRFAITHHRQRRSKAMLDSILDEVPGLGEVKRKALLREFASLKKMRAASVEQLAELPGFGPKLAQALYDVLHAEVNPSAINVSTGELIDL